MGILQKLFNFSKPQENGVGDESVKILKAPFDGEVIPLEQFPDEVFSQGILGKGCGIQPEEESVYAPCPGTISQLTPTKHAIGLTSQNGMEILIHVGVDTVDMNGTGFSCQVKEGQKVKTGQLLMTFSRQEIEKANHPCITALVITNSDEFGDVRLMAEGKVQKGTSILEVGN